MARSAQLPARKGYPGLGLPRLSRHHQGAAYAGVVQAAPVLARPAVREWAAHNGRLREAVARAHDAVPAIREPATKQVIEALPPLPEHRSDLMALMRYYTEHPEKARSPSSSG